MELDDAAAPAPSEDGSQYSDLEDYEDLTISLAATETLPNAPPPPAFPISARAHASKLRYKVIEHLPGQDPSHL